MTYTFKDHGTWSLYTPDPLPVWAQELPQLRIMFLKRDSDGVDWYEYRNADDTFATGSLVATTFKNTNTTLETIQAIFADKHMLVPPATGVRVIEIFGGDPNDPAPHKPFEQNTFDPATLTMGPPIPPPVVSVRDYQFAGQAAAEGIITDDEALQWITVGKTPQNLIDAVTTNITDPDRQKRVLLFLAGTTAFPRFHELTPLLAASFGKDTTEKLDAFFLAASQR